MKIQIKLSVLAFFLGMIFGLGVFEFGKLMKHEPQIENVEYVSEEDSLKFILYSESRLIKLKCLVFVNESVISSGLKDNN